MWYLSIIIDFIVVILSTAICVITYKKVICKDQVSKMAYQNISLFEDLFQLYKNFSNFSLNVFLKFIVTVFAHAGRTDANGGHYDYSSGGYHYHHGYPAHSHENGFCPYNFDDNVNHNRSYSSYGTRNSFYKTAKTNIKTKDAFKEMSIPKYCSYTSYEEKSNFIYYLCGFFAICSVFWLFIQFMNLPVNSSRDNIALGVYLYNRIKAMTYQPKLSRDILLTSIIDIIQENKKARVRKDRVVDASRRIFEYWQKVGFIETFTEHKDRFTIACKKKN